MAIKEKYRYFVRLDCDFVVSRNFLGSCLNTFSKIPEVATVSPKYIIILKKRQKKYGG